VAFPNNVWPALVAERPFDAPSVICLFGMDDIRTRRQDIVEWQSLVRCMVSVPV
jgi:hypothetical protein